NQWQRQVLGLPPYPLRSPFGEWLKQRQLCLYGFSPNVVPKPSEWDDEVHITGYWFLEKPDDWQPSTDLLDFLESGSPPIFVGFGSMTNRNPEAVTDMVVKALTRSGQRGLLLTGWGGLSNADLPDNIFTIEFAPFDWLFPRMAAVIHHGGAGTTAAGLRAGVPTIIVPFFGDQHLWAWRVAQLRAGPRPIPRKQLSAERLAAAIKETNDSKEIRSCVATLGQRIRSEDGVAEAVRVLNHHLAIH
ncbi:MAG: glycosyltransferase, partial [Chloroflexota bacterium]